MNLTWTSVPGKQYRIQWSDDLAAWSFLGGEATPVVVNASAGTSTSYAVPIPGPAQPVHRFYRIDLVIP